MHAPFIISWRSAVFGAAIFAALMANLYVVLVVWQRILTALQDGEGSETSEFQPRNLDGTVKKPLEMKEVFPAIGLESNLSTPSTAITGQTRIHVHVTNVNEQKRVTSRPNTVLDTVSTKRVGKFPQINEQLNVYQTKKPVRNQHSHHTQHRHNHNHNHHRGEQSRSQNSERSKAYQEHQNHQNNRKPDKSDWYPESKEFQDSKGFQKLQKFHGFQSSTPARPKHIKTPAELLRANLRRQHGADFDDDVSMSTTLSIPSIRVTAAQLRKVILPTTVQPFTKTDETTPSQSLEITIVTALLDIGRERWPHYGRPFYKYQDFMRNVLRVRAPMVIFVDSRSTEFVRTERSAAGLLQKTVIYEITIEALPLYSYHQQMQRVIDHEQRGGGWKNGWDKAMRSHPESFNCMYDIVVNSKPYFLRNASATNHFDTNFFVWLDGGYGHGESHYFPADYVWRPIFPAGHITLIKLTPETDPLARYSLNTLYRQDIAVVSGGFLAGDRKTLAKFYELYHWKFVDLLSRQNAVDDDQTTLVMLINENPNLFNVVHGDWFDAFTLF